jgi:polygalacturonase
MNTIHQLLALLAPFILCAPGTGLAQNDEHTKPRPDLKPPFEMPNLIRPVFPDRVVKLSEHGAVGDGTTLNTKAFAVAIAACADAGGGTVLVPKGVFVTGAVHLKSNINLRLEDGAEIRGSTNFDDFLPPVLQRFEGLELYNYSPLIYALNCTNIAVTGSGTINGSGPAWWSTKYSGRGPINRLLKEPTEKRVLPNKENPLRPALIQPVHCTNVYFDGFTVIDSPMWNISPLYCENLIIRNLKVINKGHNGDGIDPDSCRNIIIEDCMLDTGDDNIAIKSGRDADGRRIGKPSENIIIRRIKTKRGHGAVTMGSEMSGGIRNVFVYDCDFDGTNIGLRFKTARGRGAYIENCWYQDIRMTQVKTHAIEFNSVYEYPNPKPINDGTPRVRGIHFKNVTCAGSWIAIEMIGISELPMEDVTLDNVSITGSIGARFSFINNLRLSNVTINLVPGKPGRKDPSFRFESVAAYGLRDCANVTLDHLVAGGSIPLFLDFRGARTDNICLSNTDCGGAEKNAAFTEEARPASLKRK